MSTPNPAEATAPPAPWRRRRHAVQELAGAISSEHFPPGDLAALRRLDDGSPNAPAFWRLLLRHVDEDNRRTGAQENAWALILRGMALMTQRGRSAHDAGARVGQALAQAGYHEQRLQRLLRARGHVFRQIVPRLCRFMAAKAQPLDWRQLGELILAGSEEAAERMRRSIARDYFAAEERRRQEAAKSIVVHPETEEAS